ncbi:MAG: DUF1707 SHOCT-like domain-containing protein [Candidatus Nanopelagicales bacterium]
MSELSQPAGSPLDRLLASDSDRAKFADRLGDAFAEGRLTREEYEERLGATMSARTYGDLRPVLADLPGSGAVLPAGEHLPIARPAAHVAPASHWFPADNSYIPSSYAVAIFGGSTRKGQWVVPAELNAVAIFGGIELDLTSAYFSAQQVRVRAVAILGGIEITLPEGITVHIEGMGLLGGFDDKAAGPGEPGAPQVIIEGVAIMGGVEIKRARRMLPPP